MATVLLLSVIFFFSQCSVTGKREANIALHQNTLMHTLRETPFPADKSVAIRNPVVLMWPEKNQYRGEVLDGAESAEKKSSKKFMVRLSRDRSFQKDVFTAELPWSFYSPFSMMEHGQWFWQYGEKIGDREEWSPVLSFTVDKTAAEFNPPGYGFFKSKIPPYHPRILVDRHEWDKIRKISKGMEEREWYVEKADEVLKMPLLTISEAIDTSLIHLQDNDVKLRGYLIQQSRVVIDKEEQNIEALVRAYLLTGNKDYYHEGIRRINELFSWRESRYFMGDFNLSVLLNIATIGYDSFFNQLQESEKELFRERIRDLGDHFFHGFINHLENYIADNHVWQMTFRIFIHAAVSVSGELEEAEKWTEYGYKLWTARFPGLTDDGGWHNGDSYFHVNIRTLVEVPLLFSRITGFDFFSDPWYNNNVDYVIYQQPPFSKSAGHGNGHEGIVRPSGVRVGYAFALARECGNPYAMAYFNEITSESPGIVKKAFLSKSGDLTWYRILSSTKKLPGPVSLKELPRMKVFSQTGLATMQSIPGKWDRNAMLSFRSSPYGSTSHALADQNAFNLFYGGDPIFYSSGHRLSFIDEHSMYSYRHTRAHNSILVNGWGQKIGTEGYGWIPRYYSGKEICYVAGDASGAYGEVTSWLWLDRGRLSNIEYSQQNGWGPDKLKKFRRHIVMAGDSGLFIIYDELEASDTVRISYLLHTIDQPAIVENQGSFSVIQGKNKHGTAAVSLFSSSPVQISETTDFFYPPLNFRGKKEEGDALKKYNNHWHFSAVTHPRKIVRFLSVISVKDNAVAQVRPVILKDGKIKAGEWIIDANLTERGEAGFVITRQSGDAGVGYNKSVRTEKMDAVPRYRHSTIIFEKVGNQTVKKELTDIAPEGLII